MATEQDALRREIVGKREEIAQDVSQLERLFRQRYESVTDWNQIVRGRPLTIVGIGLALGVLLGVIAGRFSRR